VTSGKTDRKNQHAIAAEPTVFSVALDEALMAKLVRAANDGPSTAAGAVGDARVRLAGISAVIPITDGDDFREDSSLRGGSRFQQRRLPSKAAPSPRVQIFAKTRNEPQKTRLGIARERRKLVELLAGGGLP